MTPAPAASTAPGAKTACISTTHHKQDTLDTAWGTRGARHQRCASDPPPLSLPSPPLNPTSTSSRLQLTRSCPQQPPRPPPPQEAGARSGPPPPGASACSLPGWLGSLPAAHQGTRSPQSSPATAWAPGPRCRQSRPQGTRFRRCGPVTAGGTARAAGQGTRVPAKGGGEGGRGCLGGKGTRRVVARWPMDGGVKGGCAVNEWG